MGKTPTCGGWVGVLIPHTFLADSFVSLLDVDINLESVIKPIEHATAKDVYYRSLLHS